MVVVKAEGLAPLLPIAVTTRFAEVELVMVTGSVGVWPKGTLPKLSAEVDRTFANPVPLSAMLCGEFDALSVMVTAAVRAPAAVGWKYPWMVQFAPTARLVPQLFAKTNDEAFAPVTAMLEIDSAANPVLVRVTVCEVLDEPMNTEPKDRLVADNANTGCAEAVNV